MNRVVSVLSQIWTGFFDQQIALRKDSHGSPVSDIQGRALAMNGQSPFPDTIFALSTAGLPSGLAVIRLSGPRVKDALERMAGGTPTPRHATLRRLRDAEGVTLDHGLVLFFPAPASFTGEDCGELHIHGGRAVVAGVLRVLGEVHGLRQAEAGEFSRRAFINGKIDLTGAEGLADLIAAETEAQRRLAIENVEGGQQKLYDEWRNRLLYARAMIEAELDFADEADVPGSVSDHVDADLNALCREIEIHIEGFRAAEIVRDGFRVVLVGVPNAGKSSLLNALAQREVAIVTDVAGTTRDLIEVSLDLRGQKVLVTDTAGLRDTSDKVEKIGVERALHTAGNADLVLELVPPNEQETNYSLQSWDTPSLRIATKCDVGISGHARFDHVTSAHSGHGLGELIEEIGRRAREATAVATGAIPTRLRHVELLRATKAGIRLALEQHALELKAEQLRIAADSLGRITGAIEVEELLGVIFSQFCVGK